MREDEADVAGRQAVGEAWWRTDGGPGEMWRGTDGAAAGDPVEVWRTTLPGWSPGVERLVEVLDVHERERAGRLVHERDRAHFVASHAALRSILGSRLGLPPREVPLTRKPCPRCGGPHGRPAVEGADLHLSVARSDGVALFALARVPVGIDVEAVAASPPVEEVWPALHPTERDAVEAVPPDERAAVALRCWVRKEAYLKGLGVGLAREPAEVPVGPGRRPAAAPVTTSGPGGWRLVDLPAGAGQVAALAVAPGSGDPPPLVGRRLPLGAVLARGRRRDDRPPVSPPG